MSRRTSGRTAFIGSLLVFAANPVLAADCSVSSGLTLPNGIASLNLGGTFASSFLQGVANRWNDPCGTSSGGRFPALLVGSGDLAVTINFFNNRRDDPGTGNGCEQTRVHTDPNTGAMTDATINVWAQEKDGTGCDASTEDLTVHGLGHVLGLADTPDPSCDGTIMGRPVPVRQ